MKRGLALLLAAAFCGEALAQAGRPDKVIEVRQGQAGSASFEGLWADYVRLDTAGDAEGAGKVLTEIARLRVERNIGGLDAMALALVAKGLDKVRKGERDPAELYFRGAIGLDPRLPDAYLGMAQAQFRKGPLGIAVALKQTLTAVTAGLGTSEGQYRLLALVIPAALLALLATATAVALALMVRSGSLLLHDLEEHLSPTRGLVFARGVFLGLVLLPVALLEGYAWLPLWWMALLFAYMNLMERIVAVVLLLASVAVGPAAQHLDAQARANQNPLYRAAMVAVDGGPDELARDVLAKAAQANAGDRDLQYLLAREHRKTGHDEEAANIYREILKADAKDAIALNNLGNIEFYRGDFAPASARYTQGSALGADAAFTATFFYNLAQAHLQKFEFQPAAEARKQADRLDVDLTKSYENLWRYERAGAAVYAVVDLGLSRDQVVAKFAGRRDGVALKNIGTKSSVPAGASDWSAGLVNRFLGFVGVFVACVLAVARWRGSRTITLRCNRCGTAFSRRVTAQDTGELCTQCYHLFVVRDGVSPSAKNKKLLEVQREDSKRLLTFRLLSLLTPGAGHVFGRQPIPGLLLLLVWFSVISISALAGRPFSVTGAPASLLGGWLMAPAGIVLLLVFLIANRFRPSFEAVLPAPRRTPTRRPAAAQ